MRKLLIIILIIFFLFLTLEIFQRGWYAYRKKTIAPFFYGSSKYSKILEMPLWQNTFFRPPFAISKDKKKKNLLFIGGSSAWGHFNDNFHTFPFLLESKVKGISCLNAGRPGINSKDYLDILKACCEKFCIPDMVIFYAGYNDIFCTVPFDNKIVFMMARYSFLILTIKEKFIFLDLNKKRLDPTYRMYFVNKFE